MKSEILSFCLFPVYNMTDNNNNIIYYIYNRVPTYLLSFFLGLNLLIFKFTQIIADPIYLVPIYQL